MSVVDWESIVHENVRSNDGLGEGNVDAILGDVVVIMSQGDREKYNLSKSLVEGYNSAEVSLKVTVADLEKYKA